MKWLYRLSLIFLGLVLGLLCARAAWLVAYTSGLNSALDEWGRSLYGKEYPR